MFIVDKTLSFPFWYIYLRKNEETIHIWKMFQHRTHFSDRCDFADFGVGKWYYDSVYVLAWSVIGRLMVCASFFSFALTMLTIRSLSVCLCQQLAPTMHCRRQVQQRSCHVLLCLCDKACKKLSVVRVGIVSHWQASVWLYIAYICCTWTSYMKQTKKAVTYVIKPIW